MVSSAKTKDKGKAPARNFRSGGDDRRRRPLAFQQQIHKQLDRMKSNRRQSPTVDGQDIDRRGHTGNYRQAPGSEPDPGPPTSRPHPRPAPKPPRCDDRPRSRPIQALVMYSSSPPPPEYLPSPPLEPTPGPSNRPSRGYLPPSLAVPRMPSPPPDLLSPTGWGFSPFLVSPHTPEHPSTRLRLRFTDEPLPVPVQAPLTPEPSVSPSSQRASLPSPNSVPPRPKAPRSHSQSRARPPEPPWRDSLTLARGSARVLRSPPPPYSRIDRSGWSQLPSYSAFSR